MFFEIQKIKRAFCWSALAIFCWLCFWFQTLPNWRDLTTLDYYYNLEKTPWDLGRVQRETWNFGVSKVHLQPAFLATLFWSGTFLGGLILARIYFPKLQRLLFEEEVATIYNLALSFLYIFNPWTLERVLMGQYNVLRGHFLIVPVLYFALRAIKTPKTANFLYFVLWLAILSVVSTHHLIFVAITLAIYLLTTKNAPTTWLKIFVPLSLLGYLRSGRYTNSTEYDYYNQTIKGNSSQLLEIVRNFSLQISDGGNLLVQGLIGMASWNTKTFQEYTIWQKDLGDLKNVLIIFNPVLQALLFGLIIAIIGLFVRKFQGNLLDKIWLLLVAACSLILNFGLSNYFVSNINSIFYNLPLSYSLREPGKFYSLFLLALIIIIGSLLMRKRRVTSFLLIILCLNFGLTFLGMNEYYQKVDFGSRYKEISSICKNEKVLTLPFDGYYTPNYSKDIYNVNTLPLQLDCQVVPIEDMTLANVDSKEINYLSRSEFSKNLETASEQICTTPKLLQDLLGNSKIKYLLLDTKYYPELNQNLLCYKDSFGLKLQNGELYLFEVRQ